MNKTFGGLFLAALAVSLSIFSSQLVGANNKAFDSPDKAVFNSKTAEYKTLQGEIIQIRPVGEAVSVLNKPHIQSAEDLSAFATRAEQRLMSLEDAKNRYFAIVTFRKPVSESELDRITAGADVLSAKYISYPDGIGEIPYPITGDVRSRLNAMEEDIKTQMAGYNDVHDFKLISGFVAAKLSGGKEDLVKIRQNRVVFVVDVGPVDEAKALQTKDIKVAPTTDVYQEYTAYGSGDR